jgi:hypothetical protein
LMGEEISRQVVTPGGGGGTASFFWRLNPIKIIILPKFVSLRPEKEKLLPYVRNDFL